MSTSTMSFSMSSYTTISQPVHAGKQPYLASPYLVSPFQTAPSTPLQSAATPSPAASGSSSLRMLDVRTEDEVFDLAFHPTLPLFVAGLITGELQLYRMDGRAEQQVKSAAARSLLKTVKEEEDKQEDNEDEDEEGSESEASAEEEEGVLLKPSYLTAPTLLSTSCPHTASVRSVTFSSDGSRLYTASSDQSLSTFALTDSELRAVDSIQQAHSCAINVVKVGAGDRDGMLATGDDDGYVKVWDTRQHNRGKQSQPPQQRPQQQTTAAGADGSKGRKRKKRKTGKPVELQAAAASGSTAAMSFAESGDYISDLLLSDSHLLLSSSGDGHLQVFDLRRAGSWYAQSEAVDDDLLSLCCVVKKRGKGGVDRRRKVLVGSKESGVHVYSWDYWKRADEHFAYADSADCIVELDTPATTANVVAIGSSEGSLGLCTLWPHTLHHTIGRHAGAQPIEAVRLSGRVRVQAGMSGGGWAEGSERDSRWLVSAGHDKRIRLWDVTSVCELGVKQEDEEDEEDEEEEEDGEEDESEEEGQDEEAEDEAVNDDGVGLGQAAEPANAEVSSEQAAERASDSDESDTLDASKQPSITSPAAAPSGGLDRAAMVAALKRKIAAAKQRKATERQQAAAAGRTAGSSSDEDDSDSDEDGGSKGAQKHRHRQKPQQQQQPKKKGPGGKGKGGFFDGL